MGDKWHKGSLLEHNQVEAVWYYGECYVGETISAAIYLDANPC